MSFSRQPLGVRTQNFYYPTDAAQDKVEQNYNDKMSKVNFRIDRSDIHLMEFLGRAGSRGLNPPLWLKDEKHVRNFDTKEFKKYLYR